MNERDVFLAAIEINDPQQRSAYVAEACGDDVTLRAEVQSLLENHDRSSQFLETPAAAGESAMEETVFTNADFAGDATPNNTGHAEFLRYLQPAARRGWMGRLGHYEIEEILGRGAFGIVAKAFDEKLQRVVAIKMMNPDLATTSPPRKRFLREARTAAAVTHENIVAIHAVEEEPMPYLVMEYIPGQTLQQRMDDTGPLDVSEVLRIGQQITAGLAAAHSVNLIHRDIKPSNILLTGGPNERVKISDFGLARAVDDAALTSSGLIAGTPMYMAPEQALGQKLDQRADLFSVGSVLYQMLSGRPPFRAPTTVAVLKRVAEDPPRSIQEIVTKAPDWLCEIISSLHAKSPDDRLSTAAEVSELLADCLADVEAGRIPAVYRPTLDVPGGNSQRNKLSRSPHKTLTAILFPTILLAAGLAITEMSGVTHLLREGHGPTADSRRLVTEFDTASKSSSTRYPPNAPPAVNSPFSADQAELRQQEWAEYVGVPVEFTNSIGMTFRTIPPGRFRMGSADSEVATLVHQAREEARTSFYINRLTSESPAHVVVLTKPFAIGIHEVTRGQFRKFVNATGFATEAENDGKGGFGYIDGRSVQDPNFVWDSSLGFEQNDRHPVVNLTWNDAATFCEWLSNDEGETYRLPTEAEWEFVCRAGSQLRYCCGNDQSLLADYAWYAVEEESHTKQVGEKRANAFGVFDLHGNVWEWCQDRYGPYTSTEKVDPVGPSQGLKRLLRGGSSYVNAPLVRSSFRNAFLPEYRGSSNGFRVVRELSLP